MTYEPPGVDQAGLDIFTLEPAISGKNGLDVIARGKHVQYMLHCESSTSNNRLATENIRIYRDALE